MIALLRKIFDQELHKISKKYSAVGVAVSGGSDSLALFQVVESWARDHRVRLCPLIVDHGLRADSKKEAQTVAKWLCDFGPQILEWKAPRPGHQWARQARYALLVGACHRYGLEALFLGHHLNDVLETVWMRQKQNSHWRGLSGISIYERIWDIDCIRPFLSLSKDVLRESLSGKKFIKDPSNDSLRFMRTHARNAVHALGDGGRTLILHSLIEKAQKRIEEQNQILKVNALSWHDQGYAKIRLKALQILNPDTGKWILWHAVKAVKAQDCPIKAEVLSRLWTILVRADSPKRLGKALATVGGCLFTKDEEDNIFVCREWGRLKRPLFITDGGFWDGRFWYRENPNEGPIDAQRKVPHFFLRSFPSIQWARGPLQPSYYQPVFMVPSYFV